MNPALRAQAKRMEKIALELEKAAAHARTAAGHFRSGEVPRAGAHALALHGHLLEAGDSLSQIAKEHRKRARA